MRVEGGDADAEVVYDDDGERVLRVRPGLLSPRAFVALVLALESLGQEGRKYLQSTG